MAEDRGVDVEGASFWRVRDGAGEAEANTRDRVALDAEGCAWEIDPLAGGGKPGRVASGSREVRWFLSQVIAEKARLARRSVVRPAPKPRREVGAQLSELVACRLCLGEAWPDCEVCGGEGWLRPGHDEERD